MKTTRGLTVVGLLCLLVARPQRTFFIFFISIGLASTALSNTPDPLIGKVAPLLSSKKVLGLGLLKLTNLRF